MLFARLLDEHPEQLEIEGLPMSGCSSSRALLSCVVVAVLPLVAVDAAAQTSVQIPLQIDFINPGAKSLAIGGAFVGIADDATAGFANPAGLRELNRPEVSVEVRGRAFDSLFLERGRLSGIVSNEGTDVIQGAVFAESRDSHVGISYLAAVYASSRRRWAIAGFRHELARVDQTFFSQGVFQQDPAELTSRRDSPQEGIRQIAITSYSAAGAVELTPHVAIGGTLGVYTFDLDSQFRRFDVDGFLGPPILTTELGRSSQIGSDVAVAPSAGIRACLKRCEARDTMSVRGGLVYRHGPTFAFDTQDGPNVRSGRFRVPHVLVGGAALEVPQQGRRLLFTVDVGWIGYSRLLDDFVTDQAVAAGVESNVFIDDGVEVHAGFQYTAEGLRWLPRFRAGIWSDPDHSVNYRATEVADSADSRLRDERLSVALSAGERTWHYAGGMGLTLAPRVEWNVGVDIASRASTVSTSLIVKLTQ